MLAAVAALVTAVGAIALWLGLQVVTTGRELEAVADDARLAVEAAAAGDAVGVRDAIVAATAHADAAERASADVIWHASEAVPVLGAHTRALRTAAAETDRLTGALSKVADVLWPQDHGPVSAASVEVEAVLSAAPALRELATVSQTAAERLAGVDADGLVGPLASGIRHLQDALADAATASGDAADAAGAAAALLGAREPRDILLIVQNPAEVRTGGGITGSFVLLRAEAGTVELVAHADSSEFPASDASLAEPGSSLALLHGEQVTTMVQNLSVATDFERTAELALHWWQRVSAVEPDAVVSIDPFVLRALLRVTGPVELDGADALTADDVIERMLVEPYLTLDPAAQSAFQRTATTAVFAAVFGEELDAIALTRALWEPVSEGRVSAWSARADEQALLHDSMLGGPLARHQRAGDDAYALALNDTTTGKLDSFLHTSVTTSHARCRADGRVDVSIEVTLHSTVPPASAQWPDSMLGGARGALAPGQVGTTVAVAAPPGADYGGVFTDGRPVLSANAEESGFPTSVAATVLDPGASTVLTFRFVAPADSGEPRVLTPPLLHRASTEAVAGSCG